MTKYTKNPTMGSGRRALHRSGSGRSYLAWFAARFSLICLLIFCAAAARVHYQAATERLNKRAARIRVQLEEVNTQAVNYRVRKEHLTAASCIRRKIRRYGLNLRAAEYRQITCVRLADVPRPRTGRRRASYRAAAPVHRSAREYALLGMTAGVNK